MTARLVALIGAGLLAGGCNKLVGGVLADTTSDLVLPKVMELGDVGLGCASGEAFGGMIAAYSGVSPKALKASVMTTMSAAMCLDEPVWEAELELARAMKAGDVTGAKDADARLGRLHEVAAERYLEAHSILRDAYGIPAPGEDCPKLKHTADQLTYMLGLSAGVLAVVHDLPIAGRVGVPLSIPAEVVRAADCLDDDAWWGAPAAMKASVWALQPTAPGAGDAWATFEASMAKGEAARVRLPAAFTAQTAATVGHTEALRKAIVRHAHAVATDPPDSRWRMLDVYASRIVRFESDRIWTAATGHRTPFGALGTFPDDEAPEDLVEPDLLDDLLAD
ncbi:MAG: hypothetical protein H6732_00080 [Alphaproteobacteria bacterium]|nr:hypothetical protein [Alphaproteobacteria bacterium]